MSFGKESTRTDQPNFPPQHFLTKAIQTARMPRQRRTKWWVGLKMNLKIFWPDFSSINTLPPKSQCPLLDLSVLCHTPSKILSHPARSRHLRHLKPLTDSKFAALRCPFYNIGASACLMAAFSGFYEIHAPTPSGDVRGIVPVHRRPSKRSI